MFASLDGDGDGNVTEAELRAAAEERSIVLTEEQVAAFLAADADLDGGVSLDEYLQRIDGSVMGITGDGAPGSLKATTYCPPGEFFTFCPF